MALSTEKNVDAIVYCTGYLYSFPFLSSLDPPLITDGSHVENLYQHVLYRPDPTLAFPVLNQRVIPFPMAEAQAAVMARVWSGRLQLPSEEEMASWESETKDETERGRDFHLLQFPKDADYLNMLHDWASSVDDNDAIQENGSQQDEDRHTAPNGHKPMQNGHSSRKGKEPPYWGEKEYWMRAR